MKTTQHGWTVIDEDAGVLTREYTFAPKSLARMMTARLVDGRLVVASPASGLSDEAYKELETFGGVGAIVATNGFHHMGVPAWHAAFPAATLHAPVTAKPRLLKKQKAVQHYDGLDSLKLVDGGRVLDVPAQRIGETWLQVPTQGGPVWYVSDSCFSMPAEPAALLPRLLFKWFAVAPGFKLNMLGIKLFTSNRAEYRRWMLAELEREAPTRILTAHGVIIEGPQIAAELRQQIETRLKA